MSSITEFYENEQVLITGGTGFVGKLLINKLLLSCPEIGKIILLIRKTENETNVNHRMDNLFADEIFDPLKLKHPKYLEKVVLVEGNCEQLNLGLSCFDRLMLTERVTVIFHCAANVEFDLDLATELKINVAGALEIVTLAHSTQNLKALVYVSSAYSNCHLPIVEEKYYKPPVNYKTLMKLAETNFLNENERSILGHSQSTYFFSKAVAEAVIHEEGKRLPVAIFRPSAIISTWKEPIPGWTNKAFAPTAIVKSIALGRISSVHCNDTVIVDMVPADLTINALIAVGWDVHNRYINHELYEPRIYNYVSMVDNPLPFKNFLIKCFGLIQQNPPLEAVWYPTLSIHKYKFVNQLCSLTRPWLLTAFVYLLGPQKWKYRMVKTAVLYTVLMKLLGSIIEHPHIYTNDNVRKLWNDMNESDRHLYFFDMKQFVWNNFLKEYYNGIQRFLLNGRNQNEKAVNRRMLKLQIIHIFTKVAVYTFGFILLSALMSRFI